MSPENVAVVRGMWESFLRNDFEGALSAFDPDVEWDGTNLPDGTISRGRDAVLDHVSRWAEMWDTWTVELDEVIDAGALHGARREDHVPQGFSDADQALREAGITPQAR